MPASKASRRRSSKWRTAVTATFHFCPDCGSDVYYEIDGKVDDKFNDLIAIPLGAFDDPYFLNPAFSVWEGRKHNWVEIVGSGIEHD